ncbi:WD40 repeat domain-containing protein [Streptomyces scopuliridis]|uniref:WD40 repeat domain-containing protein n=1 Tax=Streptomyces scopuliridis TaxID=452529 RepID=UPI0036AE903A
MGRTHPPSPRHPHGPHRHGLVGRRQPGREDLATIGDDRAIRLWDIETHQRLALYTGHTGVVHSVLFSPDGNTLATSGNDGTVRLWDTDVFNDLATLTHTACTIAGRSLTEREWRRYVPGGVAYHRICP